MNEDFTERAMSPKQIADLNSNLESDINCTISACRSIALMLGLWPTSSLDFTIKRVIKVTINLTACCLMTFVIVSNILYGIFEINTLDQKVELVGATNFYTMSLAKYLLILFRGKSIERCLKYIEEDWQFVKSSIEREIMLEYAKFGRYMTIICATFMYGGGLGYQVFKPLSADKIITEMNVTITPFPSPVYGKQLTSGLSPSYEILYGTLIVADFFLFSSTVVAFSVAAVLTIHACGQFEIVVLYLNDLVNGLEEKKDSAQERLIVIIDSHLRILSFVSQLEALLNEICFIEVVDCSLNLCLLGYCLITSYRHGEFTAFMSYCILLVSFIFIMYIYCYLGELLTTQAEKIGQQGYMIDWHRLPKSILLDLLFFIHVCQFPTAISAGKIIVLSIGTFSAVMRTSAAYFNALWKMSQ